jgi:hypothetical protein
MEGLKENTVKKRGGGGGWGLKSKKTKIRRTQQKRMQRRSASNFVFFYTGRTLSYNTMLFMFTRLAVVAT